MRRDIFQAISDPSRRAILVLLSSQAMTAGAIASQFDTARPTISRHLQILNECEVIEASQQGREIYYQLKIEKLNEIDQWLEQFRKIWKTRFDQLNIVFETLKNRHDEK